MKIGIVTFWWSKDNYGQILQCYALQKYLRNLGHDAYLIRYNRQDYDLPLFPLNRIYKAFNPIKLFRFIKMKLNRFFSKSEQQKNPRYFDVFKKENIVASSKLYSSYKELQENPPEADCYIVGSDQVWNFGGKRKMKECRSAIHAFFLDFGSSNIKRISYAASFSCTDLQADIIAEIKPLLARFDYVSVRETSGLSLCKICGREDAVQDIDPTMLLTADTYRNLYRKKSINAKKNKYLLLYLLSNPCEFDIQKAYDFAHEKGLEVIYITGNGRLDKYEKTFATIEEWLYYIDNAEYVITNSYHASVFSLKFNTKFAVIPLKGEAKTSNVRFETLFEQWKVKPRFVIHSNLEILENELNSTEPNPQFEFIK